MFLSGRGWGGITVQEYIPRGSIYTTILELETQNHNEDGLLGPNSIIIFIIWTLNPINPKPKTLNPKVQENIHDSGLYAACALGEFL